MAINKDVNIRVTTKNENPQSWKELNVQIKETRSELVRLQSTGKVGTEEWDKYTQKLRELTKEKKIVTGQTKLTAQQLLGLSRDLTVVMMGVKNVMTGFKELSSTMKDSSKDAVDVAIAIANVTGSLLALSPAIISISRAFPVLWASALAPLLKVLSAIGAVVAGLIALDALSKTIGFQMVETPFGVMPLPTAGTGKSFGENFEDSANDFRKWVGGLQDDLLSLFDGVNTKELEANKSGITVTQHGKNTNPKVTVTGKDNLNIIDEYKLKVADLEKKLQQIEKDGGLGSALWFKTKEELEQASIELQAFGVNLNEVAKTSLKVGDNLETLKVLPVELEKEIELAKENAEIFRLQNLELVTYSQLMDEILAKKEYAEALKNAIDTTVSGFQTIFGLLSDWTGDAENGVSRFFKTIEQSFGILQQMITFMETIKSISEAIKAVEIASGANSRGGTNFFEGLIGFVTQFFADGGLVQGAGTGKSDSIPTRLSNGEFVVNAESTKRFYPLLEMINGRSRNLSYGFANGGFVNVATGQGAPIYIMANMDGLTFMRVNAPKYNKWKKSVRV